MVAIIGGLWKDSSTRELQWLCSYSRVADMSQHEIFCYTTWALQIFSCYVGPVFVHRFLVGSFF